MDGILLVDKPQGFTSHGVVDLIRKKFSIPKAGHAGTLDPMATGLLVILIGNLTKASSRIMSGDKEYEARLVLGATSDTQDAWGRIGGPSGTVNFTGEEIEWAFAKFRGEIEQSVPMYSAVKKAGRPLYELARRGIKVDVKPRKVRIDRLEVIGISMPEIAFRVSCSKGTYVRQLASDIGDALGCGAYLSMLRRTRSGCFTVDKAVTIDFIRALERGGLEKVLTKE